MTEGQANLAQLADAIDATKRRLEDSTRRRLAILSQMADRREAMASQEGQTLATKEDLAKLRADVESSRGRSETSRSEGEGHRGH